MALKLTIVFSFDRLEISFFMVLTSMPGHISDKDLFSQANMQSGNPHDQTRQESETDLKLCSRVYNDESSLGLSGIKWVHKYFSS